MKKIWSLIILTVFFSFTVIGCSSAGKYTDGTYTGAGKGLKGDIEISMQIKGGKIEAIEVVKQDETGGLFDPVKNNLIPDIIKKQATEGVEAITGATASSNGLMDAVNDALTKAGK